MATDKSNSPNEIWHWINDKIGVAVESWLCWTHDLIAQSIRASERNTVVVSSNPAHANFLLVLQKNASVVNTIYIYIYIYTFTYIYKCIYIYIYILYILSVIHTKFTYQNWNDENMYSIRTAIELELPMSGSSIKISKFHSPTNSEYKSHKARIGNRMPIGFELGSPWLGTGSYNNRLRVRLLTTRRSTNNGGRV